MNIRSISTIAIVGFASIAVSGCSDSPEIQFVKNGQLQSCPNMTVNEMVEGFLGDPSWDSGTSENGQSFVNIGGDFTLHEKEVRGVIQFTVDMDGGEFQFNAFEINEVPQNQLVAAGLLTKMCEHDGADVRANVDEAIASVAVARLAAAETCMMEGDGLTSLSNENTFYSGPDSSLISSAEISGSCANGENIIISIMLTEEIGAEPFEVVLLTTMMDFAPGEWNCLSNGPREQIPEYCQQVDVD